MQVHRWGGVSVSASRHSRGPLGELTETAWDPEFQLQAVHLGLALQSKQGLIPFKTSRRYLLPRFFSGVSKRW